MNEAVERLGKFFEEYPRMALAFSGGVDSAYLLHAAVKAGCDVRPYYLHTQFQSAVELADVRRLAADLGVELCVIENDILANEAVRKNPADRCYFCKRALFAEILDAARRDGYALVVDGTNASDDVSDRPGMRALRELKVRSPLREAGLSKPEIRARSREAGLFTWDKPANACLATRIPTGVAIEAQALHKVERAEDALRAMGFSDLRVRVFAGAARLQLPEGQMAAALQRRGEILSALCADFEAVLLDLKAR